MFSKRRVLIGAGLAAVVAVLGVGAVMAQSTPQSGTGTSFLDRVAQKLGIDTPKLQTAITDAHTDQIDEAVKNGDLTQKQADALKQKAQNNPNGGLGRDFGGFGPGKPGKGFGPGFGPGMALGDAGQKLADFLGIPKDQLASEMKANNATLATVAAAHGKSRDDVKKFVADTAKAALDTQVQNQNITQKVEDAMLSMLNQNVDKLLDSSHGIGKGFGFGGPGHGRGNGDGEQNDDGTVTPGSPTTPNPQGGSTGTNSTPF